MTEIPNPHGPWFPPPPAPLPGGYRPEGKGFLGALFDFSFAHFITPKIVKAVYVIATVLIALGYLYVVVASFSVDEGAGMVMLLVGWLPALVYLAFIRMTLEFYICVVRMSEDIHQRLPAARP